MALEFLEAKVTAFDTVRSPVVLDLFGSSDIEVFGALVVHLDAAALEVTLRLGDELAACAFEGSKFDVCCWLDDPDWIHIVLFRMLDALDEQRRDLYGLDGETLLPSDTQVRALGYRLQRARGFRAVRHQYLAALRDANGHVLTLALKCRPLPRGIRVSANLYELVWRNESTFERLLVESPGLMPVVALALQEQRVPPGDNVLRALKDLLTDHYGISKAAWKYLVRHGARLLRPAWRHLPRRHWFDGAVAWLQLLDDCELPPAPPRCVADALARWALRSEPDEASFVALPLRSPTVVRLALMEADKLRASDHLRQFCVQLPPILEWSREMDVGPGLDRMHIAWSGIVQRYRITQEARRRAAVRPWLSSVDSMRMGDFDVVALTCVDDMVEEGKQLNNCLARLFGHAVAGTDRYFSVRRKGSQDRVAAIGLTRHASGTWTVSQVAGPGNTSASAEITRFALAVAAAYNQLADTDGT